MDYTDKQWTCPLENSRSCRILHMKNCQSCPINTSEDANRLEMLVERFEILADGPAISRLVASKECALCKGEHKGKADAVGLWDIGYPMPKTPTKKPARKKLFGKEDRGYQLILSLQFPVCKSCRNKILLCNYLSTVITIVALVIALLLVGVESSARILRALWRGLPLLVLLALGFGGHFGGKLLASKLQKHWGKACYMDPAMHPLGKQLMDNGWLSILPNKADKLMFTKKRFKHGLGTAPEEAYKQEDDF